MRSVCAKLGARATLHIVDGGDHSSHVLKRSGRTDAEVLHDLVRTLSFWADSFGLDWRESCDQPTKHPSPRPHRTLPSWHMVKSLVAKTIAKWSDDPGPRFAAALAFYTALTIVPLVVLTLMVSVT